MHTQFTHPQFNEVFFNRFEEIKTLWDKHPILERKQSLVNSLDANNVTALSQHLDELVDVIQNQEKPLLRSIKFSVKQNNPYVLQHELGPLENGQKDFVKEHQDTVSKRCTDGFESLIEYAVISDTKVYDTAQHDYAHFQQAVDAMNQVSQLHEHIDSQKFLAQKIQQKLNRQASSIHADVALLKESHDSQLGIMARLPQFRFVSR